MIQRHTSAYPPPAAYDIIYELPLLQIIPLMHIGGVILKIYTTTKEFTANCTNICVRSVLDSLNVPFKVTSKTEAFITNVTGVLSSPHTQWRCDV